MPSQRAAGKGLFTRMVMKERFDPFRLELLEARPPESVLQQLAGPELKERWADLGLHSGVNNGTCCSPAAVVAP